MQIKRLRGLFFKAVFVLTLISLVPMALIGFYVLRVNGRMLQREILQRQQNVAGRLASVSQAYLTHISQLFIVFTDLHTDFGGHDFLDQHDLIYLKNREPSILYLAALDLEGNPFVQDGDPISQRPNADEMKSIWTSCVEHGQPYYGNVVAHEGKPAQMWMAFPIRKQVDDLQVVGVLLAEIELSGLDQALAQAYPLEMEAMVVDATGQVVSYNGSPYGLPSGMSAGFLEQLRQAQEQLQGSNRGEVTLANGKKWLVASARLISSDWRAYVLQPSNIASQLFKESVMQSSWDMLLIIGCVVLFLIGVSYVVIIPITRPVERLRTAALKMREREDYVIKREEVTIPKNELGDLAETIVEMSQALHSRREALLTAQRSLALSNQDLEQRVEERTRELKETTNELVRVERLASIGQMASIISHEIRNPLAVISNATRLIKLLIPSQEPKLTKQINIIEAEIKQANSIISEVLGYARTRELILSTIDLNSYLHDILAVYSWPANIKLVEEIESESVRIKVDAEEIKQAIRNVIANALDAMQPGGGILRVGTKIGRKVVCIFIADTGPGISAEVRQKMFSPFFTTKARGTGLGLAVVGKAISRHKGKLFISSEEGKGSCFQIYLKIYKKTGDTNYGETN